MVLDATLEIYSARMANNASTMGLYDRYAGLLKGGAGGWFTAEAADGRLVGLASARLAEGDAATCLVDAVAHRYFEAEWPKLLGAATAWARGRGCRRCLARVALQDEAKAARFAALGFVASEGGEACPDFVLPASISAEALSLPAVLLELALSGAAAAAAARL